MTKDQVVDTLVDANVAFIFAFISAKFPILNLPLIRFIMRHYLGVFLRPLVNEGTVFTALKIIDLQQASKASEFREAMDHFRSALEVGVPDEKSSIAFDDAFRRAISIKP